MHINVKKPLRSLLPKHTELHCKKNICFPPTFGWSFHIPNKTEYIVLYLSHHDGIRKQDGIGMHLLMSTLAKMFPYLVYFATLLPCSQVDKGTFGLIVFIVN